jgi:hypothetical protein
MCVCYVCVCLRVYNTHTHTQVNKNEVTLESPAFASAMLRNGHESGADRDFGSKLLFPVQMLLEALNVSPPTHTQTQEFSLQEAMEWQGGEGGGEGGRETHPGTERSPSCCVGGAESEVRTASLAKAAYIGLRYATLYNIRNVI